MSKTFLLLFVLAPLTVWSSDETRSAVSTVQDQMKDPKFHKQAAKESKEAAQVEKQVHDLAGSPDNEQAIYNLASEILGNMKDLDPQQMMKVLEEAQKDPSSYANSWTPEQKQKLRELASKLPASRQAAP